MSPQTTPIADTAQDLELSERILAPDGTRVANDRLDPFVTDVDAAQLRALHRDMVILRRIDAEGVALQRQGQLGLWAPCQGQEATQIGTARALDPQDYVFPSYRETGVIYARGAQPGTTCGCGAVKRGRPTIPPPSASLRCRSSSAPRPCTRSGTRSASSMRRHRRSP